MVVMKSGWNHDNHGCEFEPKKACVCVTNEGMQRIHVSRPTDDYRSMDPFCFSTESIDTCYREVHYRH